MLLALALSPVPELLLLDEPLAGMDHPGTLLFYEIVSELRVNIDLTIMLVSHDLAAAASVADRLVFLNHTVLCDGSPAEVLHAQPVRDTFGLDLTNVSLKPVRSMARVPCCPSPSEGKTK